MNRIIERLRDMSLRSRLFIAIVLCVLLPWFGTYIVSNYLTTDVLEEHAAKQSKDTLSLIELNIKGRLDGAMQASNYIQFDTNFNRLLKSSKTLDLNNPEATGKDEMANYIKVSEALSDLADMFSSTYITILFEDGPYYMNYPKYEYDPLEFKEKSWFEELKKLNVYQMHWLGAHPTYIQSEKESNPYLISMARTIQISHASNIYLILSLHEKTIRNFFEALQLDTDMKFFLTDENGKVFSSLNEKEIGQSLQYDFDHSTYQIVDYGQESHLLVSYPVSYTNWQLVSLAPYEETIGGINTGTRTTLIIQGILLLVFLIGLIILIREMIKPVAKLSLVTKAVERGNFNRRAKIKGNHDVAKLAQSFDHMLDKIEEMIDQIKRQEEEKRMAEIEMLQAQINPHFLFNTLNSMRLKIRMHGDQESAELIYALSALLRMTINRNNAFIPLGEELTTVQHYLQLMNFRHQEDIQLEIKISQEIKENHVPRFFLQPIVENAFIHGYHERHGQIHISAELVDAHFLKLKIADDGVGMDEDKLNKLKQSIFVHIGNHQEEHQGSFNGIGIRNVYQRMKLIYGESFNMLIESTLGKGTAFIFYIPIEKGR